MAATCFCNLIHIKYPWWLASNRSRQGLLWGYLTLYTGNGINTQMGKNHNERWTNDMHTGCYLDTDQSAQMHIHVDLLKSWGASAKSVATLLDLDSMSVVHKMSVFSAEQNKNKFKNPFLVGNVVFELSCDVFFCPLQCKDQTQRLQAGDLVVHNFCDLLEV